MATDATRQAEHFWCVWCERHYNSVTHSHLQQSAQQQSAAAWCAHGLWNEQGNQECPTGCARAKQQQLRDQAGSGCERNILICNDTGREEE